MIEKKRALGRGLDALLPVSPRGGASSSYGSHSVFSCAIEKLRPQRGQPRQYFDPRGIEDLAQSIEEHGLIEPLVVRKVGEGTFEIIAGERRWRAAQKAGLKEVLVVVKDVSPKSAFEMALIENVQRQDLNPIELAEAFERLLKEHGYTQERLAERVGKDRTTVTNVLRLLKLPTRVRTRVAAGELTEGHARALLGAPDGQLDSLAERVLRGKLSVRETEALVRAAASGKGKGGKKSGGADGKTSAVRDLETRLTRALGTKVEVRDYGNKGEIAIPYATLDALDRLLDRLL